MAELLYGEPFWMISDVLCTDSIPGAIFIYHTTKHCTTLAGTRPAKPKTLANFR